MHITSANCGDILCLYQTGQRIKILDVDDRTVSYLSEYGDHYATFESAAAAIVETNSERLTAFEQNSRLGNALKAAESNALQIILSGPATPESERGEAMKMLSSIRIQRDAFNQRLARERSQETPGHAISSAFLSQLYERGTGSHDTFWGHRVENISQMSGTFSINGERFDYASALRRLSQLHLHQPTKSLETQIQGAWQRKAKPGSRASKDPFCRESER